MLGVHVLGPGFGETIIIELPNGEMGVVDSFAARFTGPPALEYLRVNHPTLKKLKFVALTHPHADHCMGMSRYFDKYEVEEFWYFHSFALHTCMGFFKAMHSKKTEDAVEKALGLPSGSVWIDALKLRDAVDRQGTVRPRSLMATRTIELCGGAVTAKIVTPNDVSVWRYNNMLATTTEELLDDGPKLDPNWDPSSLPHNQASGSILFEYGQTRILLMADAEDDLWADVTNEQGDSPLPKVHFIKGAHHGSKNGYNGKIYACAADKNTVLVITPFNRHKYPLPTGEGVNYLLPHVKDVYCTNSVEACDASGLAWKCVTTRPSPALPPEWIADCRANPRLLSLLDDQQAKYPYSPGAVPLPRKWTHDCQMRPELLQLLCPPLRNRKVTAQRPDLVNEFRVSMKYDNRGNVVDRFIGWGVGHLPGA